MKFRTGGKTYTAAALTRPSIRDYMKLAISTEALGHKLTSADVFRIEQEIADCKTDKERAEHPDLLMFLALVVWATLIEAGEPDPFNRAMDTRLDDLDFIVDPADHQVASDPFKARTRAASARAAKRPAAAKRAAAKTLRTQSTPAS